MTENFVHLPGCPATGFRSHLNVRYFQALRPKMCICEPLPEWPPHDLAQIAVEYQEHKVARRSSGRSGGRA